MNPFGARVMQVSFKRLPEEHADSMIRAGRLFLETRAPRKAVPYLVGAVIFGILCGLGIEAFRQLVLAPYLGIGELPTVQVIVLEMLPVMLAIGLGAVMQREIVRRGRRRRLIASLAENVIVDVDIYERGMETSIGGVFTYGGWSTFHNVARDKNGVRFLRDDTLFEIPARAFKDRQDFETRGQQIVDLWTAAATGPAIKAPLDLRSETRH